MRDLLSHLRYSVRLLVKSPGFAITAVLVIGCSTGANTAMFTLINTVLLRPLDYPESDRMVSINMPTQEQPNASFDYPDYLAYRGALVLIGFLGSLLYGVGRYDPTTVAVTILALCSAALSACLPPALRAARISPTKALRE